MHLLLRGGISTSRSSPKSPAAASASTRARGGREAGRRGRRQDRSPAWHEFRARVPPVACVDRGAPRRRRRHRSGIPLDAVRSALRVATADISRAPAVASIVYGAEAIPFLPLAAALRRSTASADRNWSAVVVAGAGGLAAVGIDRLLGTARVVVRPLPAHAHAERDRRRRVARCRGQSATGARSRRARRGSSTRRRREPEPTPVGASGAGHRRFA